LLDRQPPLRGQGRRHAVAHRAAPLRPCLRLAPDLRGEPGHDRQPRHDPSGPGAGAPAGRQLTPTPQEIPMIRHSRLIAPGLALAALFVLSACDRRDDTAARDAENPPPVATDPAPTDMPDATGTTRDPNAIDNPPGAAVTVDTIEPGTEVGADNRVPAALRTLATGDTLHATIRTDDPGGQVVHTEDKVVPAGEQVTDFMVTNPSGWPTGEYEVEVSVDGQVVATRQFDVR